MKYPLVMLAGLLSDEAAWKPVADRLGDVADCRIINFPGIDSITAMAQEVLDTSPERFALAGHSMGGRVALECWRLAPERITGLGMFNTGVDAAQPGEESSRMALVHLARKDGMAAMAAHWLPPMLGDDPVRLGEVTPELIAMVDRQTPDSFQAQQRALLNRPDASPVLSTISVPVLFLSALQDKWSPLEQHGAMQAEVERRGDDAPWTRLVGLDKAGHFAPVERPQGAADAIRDWLEQLAPVG